MKPLRIISFVLVILAGSMLALFLAERPQVKAASSDFLIQPYVQIGSRPPAAKTERLNLLWSTNASSSSWTVEIKWKGNPSWTKTAAPSRQPVSLDGIEPFFIYTATLAGLTPGESVQYRVARDGIPVFAATANACKAAGQPCRFDVFGDCGCGSRGQKQIAYQVFQSKPDFVMVTGDIVYNFGRMTEYLRHFFPVYNADQPSAEDGVPLLRSTLFIAAPGNHDIAHGNNLDVRNLDQFPDGLAYFLLWSQPLNGPTDNPGSLDTPVAEGSAAHRQAFLTAAGKNYPRMANFSFNYGSCHWTVLDADPYMNWTDKKLRDWLEKDLASAASATWKFVAFHQPGFNSDSKHFEEQRMRLVCDILEKYKVDVVFNGHVHNYQRTFPLHFTLKKQPDGNAMAADGTVSGDFRIDRTFDGRTSTKPDGIIYIITGGGGAPLSGAHIQNRPEAWQPFTAKVVADQYSFSECSVDGKTLVIHQIAADGKELDKITVTK